MQASENRILLEKQINFLTEELADINTKILPKSNFKFTLSKTDTLIFSNLIKQISKQGFSSIFTTLRYLSIQNSLNLEQVQNNMDLQNFLLKQIILLFIYLSHNYIQVSQKNLNQIFKYLYKIFSHLNSFNDIILFNITYTLNNITINNISLFMLSIKYVNSFCLKNNPLDYKSIFDIIYNEISINIKSQFYIRKLVNDKSFIYLNYTEAQSLLQMSEITFSSQCNDEFKDIIYKIIYLIFGNNFTILSLHYFISKARESFYDINNSEKILKNLKQINNQIQTINKIIEKENEINAQDKYSLKNYFVFNSSASSGLYYDTSKNVFDKNFTIIFSFKFYEIEKNKTYPLLTFINDKEVSLNFSIKNEKFCVYFQNGFKEFSDINLVPNKTYLIYFENNKKLVINLNEENKQITCGKISVKHNTSLQIGYVNGVNTREFEHVSNFVGIMGSVVFIGGIIDSKNFVEEVYANYGNYENMLDYSKYIINTNNLDPKISSNDEKTTKKVRNELLFYISPLAMLNEINYIDKKRNKFHINVNGVKNNLNSDIGEFFQLPPSNINDTDTTYAVSSNKTLYSFMEYDGVNLMTLYLEYFYNVLKMLKFDDEKKLLEKEKEIQSEINNALIPLIKLLNNIFEYSNVDKYFVTQLDRLGFSLLKVLSLIMDEKYGLDHILLDEVKNIFVTFTNEIKGGKKDNTVKISKRLIIISNYLSKLFALIFKPKFFDASNYKQINNFFKVFSALLYANKNLICYNTLETLLTFDYFLLKDPTKEFDTEYKELMVEYKKMLEIFFTECPDLNLYVEFIKSIAEEDNRNVKIKYKLLKIYYNSSVMKKIFYKEKTITSIGKNITNLLNVFSIKENPHEARKFIRKDLLINEYQNSLGKIIDITNNLNSDNEPKDPNDKTIYYYELMKSLLIQLIYDHAIVIIPSFFDVNFLKTNNYSAKYNYNFYDPNERISLFNIWNIENLAEGSLNTKEGKCESSKCNTFSIRETTDRNKKTKSFKKKRRLQLSFDFRRLKNEDIDVIVDKNKEAEINLLDVLLDSNDYSFYIIKSLFCCLYDNWSKDKKLKFIKSSSDSIIDADVCFDVFNKFKKSVFQQIVIFMKIIKNNNELLRKFLNLFFSITNQILIKYKKNQNDTASQLIFYHLFESKSIMSNIFDFTFFYISKNPSDQSINENILLDIINDVLIYHPRPFISGYINKCFKCNDTNVLKIIKNIIQFLIKNPVADFDKKDNNIDVNVVSYLYYNEIKFLSCLNKCFSTYQTFTRNILLYNNCEFFNLVKSFISFVLKSELIYNYKIYTFNPTGLLNNNKHIILSNTEAEIKLLNKDSIYVTLLDIFFTSIYAIWTSVKEDHKSLIEQINIFYKEITIENHFISYYIDLFNPAIAYDQIKKHGKVMKEIPQNIADIFKNNTVKKQYYKYLLGHPCINDYRLSSIYNLIIFAIYENIFCTFDENNNNSTEKEEIKKLFETFIQESQNDFTQILKYVGKIKKNDKIVNILDKKPRIYESYYKYIYSTTIKNKIFFVSETLRNDLEKKIALDEEEQKLHPLLHYEFEANKTNTVPYNFVLKRNDSFHYYDQDYDKNRKKPKDKKNDKLDFSDNSMNLTTNFLDADEPVLCTKRDLFLKTFGYFFYNNYFNDLKFVVMKNKFEELYPADQEKNNYGGFEKLMDFNYPTIIKNYSNFVLFYPRIILRPDYKFFDNKYFEVSHNYFNKNEFTDDKFKKLSLKYGHNLLNQKDFELFSISKEKSDYTQEIFECEYIYPKNTVVGGLKFWRNFLVFQSNLDFDLNKYKTDKQYVLSSKKEEIAQKQKQVIIPIKKIRQLLLRKFLFFNQAVELYLYNGKSYFFNLYNEKICKLFILKLKTLIDFNQPKSNKNNICETITDNIDYFSKKKYTANWLDKKISTLDYLLMINKFSNRTYNDLSQYLVLPWLIYDYSDIKNRNNFRKMNLSMAIQDKEGQDLIKETYDCAEDNIDRSHFKCHYSNSSYPALFLFRLNPFTYNQIKLQGGKFDDPKRQVEKMTDFTYVFKEHKETVEMIPEYFFMIEHYLNLNFNFFGVKDNKEQIIINNFRLSKGFNSLEEIMLFHRNLLNSEEISSNVNKWIDNIFGENQLNDKKLIMNSYPYQCYEQHMKELLKNKIKELEEEEEEAKIKRKINEIKMDYDFTLLMGQCPTKIFMKAHPILKKEAANDSLNTENPDLIIDLSKETKEKIIYMNISSNMNYIYIITNKEILVYNMLMKLATLNTLHSIRKICNPFDCEINENLEEDMKENIQKMITAHLYKNLIFDIDDCKFFVIGGYLDNSFKIHFKFKDKDSLYSIITESRVTCLKHYNNKNTFFSGHQNGKITKWTYAVHDKLIDLFDNTTRLINVEKISSIIGHENPVKIIEINTKIEILISADYYNTIFIRKLYDNELLNIINYNGIYNKILEINFNKELLLLIFYNIQNNNLKIECYTPNCIKVNSIEKEGVYLPIYVSEDSDELLMLNETKFCSYNLFFEQKTNNILFNLNLYIHGVGGIVGKNKNEISKRKKTNDDIRNKTPVSYIYDRNNHIFYGVFDYGQLNRIKLK